MWRYYSMTLDKEIPETISSDVPSPQDIAASLEGAGHWVQQERLEEVSKLLIQFLRDEAARGGRS
jgi:hypothetical protein